MAKTVAKSLIHYVLLPVLAFSFSIFLLVCLIMTLLWLSPETLINQKSLKWVQTKFFPEYLVDWEKIDVKVTTLGVGSYRFTFDGHDFCAGLDIYGEACFKEVLIDIETKLSFKKINSISIPRLIVADEKISLLLPASDPNQEDEPIDLDVLKEDLKSYAELWRNLKVENMALDFKQTRVQTAEGRIIELKLKGYNQGALERFEFEAHSPNDGLPVKLKGLLSQQNDEKSWDLSAEADSPWVTARLRSEFNSPEGQFVVFSGDLQGDFKSKQIKDYARSVRTKFQLQLNQEQLTARLRPIEVTLNKAPLKSLNVTLCEAQVALAKDVNEPATFKCDAITTRIDLSHRSMRQFRSKVRDLPDALTLHLQGEIPKAWIETSPLESRESMTIALNADPVSHDLFKFEFDAATLLDQTPEGISLKDTRLNASVVLPSFQTLVQRLQGSPYSVPAPFNVMTGSLKAEISDLPKSSEGKLVLPLKLRSELTSERNSVVGDVSGQLTYPLPPSKEKPELALDVALQRFHIQLPPFDPLRGFPPLTLDSRIQKELNVAAPEQSSPLKLKINVKSAPDAIRVYHQLLKPYASFGVGAQVAENTAFEVQKAPQPFEIDYLKRKVTVQNLRVAQESAQKPTLVGGKILYKATGYDIFIEFSGTMEEPTVVLSSNPPLDRQDIISMILYNRLSSDITSFEQENVGGTEAAIADRAVGLFGLWAFASTPIESVSYNSVTKTYSAQVKLPEGFRLSIGTNWESVQNLELKRRLGGNWMVSTIYRPQTEDGEGTGEIMLQRKTSY